MDDGSEERIKVELGDHSVFPLTYAEGRAPTREDEIALSVTNANEMGKTVGDVIPVMIEGQEKALTVSGIYSDITNGGKTAKAVFSDPSADVMWSVISAELSDLSLLDAKIAEYADSFDFAKVSDIDEYMMQTYGSTISAIGKASYAAVGIALTITVLITLLFMRMLVAKDRYSIAVMKAFGFTNSDITSPVRCTFGIRPDRRNFARHAPGQHARRGACRRGDSPRLAHPRLRLWSIRLRRI